MPAKVVLDSNALMMPFQFSINLTSELERLLGTYEAFVPTGIIRELERLSSEMEFARQALGLAAKFTPFDTKSDGDASVVEAANALDAAVVTNDKALMQRVASNGHKTIFLRQGNHLEMR